MRHSFSLQLIRLSVRWQCKAYSKEGDNAAAEQPGCIVSGEALKRVQKLNIFQPCTNQIGDRYFYTLKENDIIIMKEEWKRFEKNKIREENGGVLPKPKRLKKKMKKKTKSAQTKKTQAEKIMENLPKKAKGEKNIIIYLYYFQNTLASNEFNAL